MRWRGLFLGMLAGPLLLSAGAHSVESGRLPGCAAGSVPVSLEEHRPLLELGRDLFYDPILSGNRTVACATCHHPDLGTSDGVALSLGDGATGMGRARRADRENLPEQRIPRNAQALFNLGYPEFSVLFHDGRVERLANGTIWTPHGPVPDTGLLAVLTAQAAFPVVSADEMAGHGTENDVSRAVRAGRFEGKGGAYTILAQRVAAIDSYRDRFMAWKGTREPITYRDIAGAIAAFTAFEWRADDSPFDRLICSGTPMAPAATAGMELFYGKAGCSACHSGRFQTDHGFHAIAMPQIGPGKPEKYENHARDLGRQKVTGRDKDAFCFRTPSLRNVTLTAPYGHAGAYPDLESVIRHHLDPVTALKFFDRRNVRLPALNGTDDFRVMKAPGDVSAIATANMLTPKTLSDKEITDLIAFLEALTDERGARGRLGVPSSVPSGLPVPHL